MQKIIFQVSDFLAEPFKPSKLVLINEGDWGIACEKVGKVEQMDRDDIYWRSKKAEERWIAGNSKKVNSVIIDIKRIEYALATERPLV